MKAVNAAFDGASTVLGPLVASGSFSEASTGALPDADYHWRVRACNVIGCSGWSPQRYVEVGRLPDDRAVGNAEFRAAFAADTFCCIANA